MSGHTYIQDNYMYNDPCCPCAPRVNNSDNTFLVIASKCTQACYILKELTQNVVVKKEEAYGGISRITSTTLYI